MVIPPPLKQYGDEKTHRKLRVAAYCRVSTQEEEQEGSFDIQVHHFEQRIKSNPAWELVDIYKDKGISGTTISCYNDSRREAVRMQMFGRTVIYTDVTSVTADNVRDVLTKALAVYHKNQAEIDYLYGYYKGKTPILHKKKEVRPTINHQICENRANEIVNFKTGYTFGEPIQYILRGEKASLIKAIVMTGW